MIQTPFGKGGRIAPRRYELTDTEWLIIEPLQPNKPRGVPRVDDRRVLNGTLSGRTRIIPANTFAFLNEVLASPGQYGFVNTTVPACTAASSLTCTPATLVNATAPTNYVFADGVHPTTATHVSFAQVIESEIIASQQAGLLAEQRMAEKGLVSAANAAVGPAVQHLRSSGRRHAARRCHRDGQPVTGFYDVGVLGQIGLNLFHGYGYNFYREENQLRADDQKVRALVCELLGLAQKAVSAAEGAFRRDRIPAPTRAEPFPPSAILVDARRLEALCRAIGGVVGQVRHAPVPESDHMTQRYREEAAMLAALVDKDALLVGQAETLRAMVSGRTPDDILAITAQVEEGVAAIGKTLADRRIMLL